MKMQKSVIFENEYVKDKRYCKVRDHYIGEHRGAVHIVYVIQNKVYLKKFLWIFLMDLTIIILS